MEGALLSSPEAEWKSRRLHGDGSKRFISKPLQPIVYFPILVLFRVNDFE